MSTFALLHGIALSGIQASNPAVTLHLPLAASDYQTL